MTDNNKLSPPSTGVSGSLVKPRTFGISKLHARLSDPIKQTRVDPNTCPNRIGLMLDESGSMAGDKIEQLQQAIISFVNACNFNDTALAIESFGGKSRSHLTDLTTQQPLLMITVMGLQAYGGTPLHEAMDYVLHNYPITRGVIVSDGQADHPDNCTQLARNFKEAGIPVDCVHIGDSTHGEALLQQIAEITGGMFMKFTDITAFAKNFKYLTPAYYAQLTSGSVDAKQLGAREIK